MTQTLPTNAEIEEFIRAKVSDSSDLWLYTPVISRSILPWPKKYLLPNDSAGKNYLSIYKKSLTVFLDSILTIQDKDYITLQADSFKNRTWEIEGIRYAKRKKEKKSSVSLSFPLFSLNKEYVIIRQLYLCGTDCGNVHTQVYKKIGGRWLRYGYVNGGVF